MLNFVFSQLFVFIALSIFFTLKSYMSQDTGKYLEALLYSVMVVILLAILESLNKTYPGLGAKVVIISPTFFTNVNAEGVPLIYSIVQTIIAVGSGGVITYFCIYMVLKKAMRYDGGWTDVFRILLASVFTVQVLTDTIPDVVKYLPETGAQKSFPGFWASVVTTVFIVFVLIACFKEPKQAVENDKTENDAAEPLE